MKWYKTLAIIHACNTVITDSDCNAFFCYFFASITNFFITSFCSYFTRKRAERAEEMHLASLAHIEKIKNLSSLGKTPLQLHLSDHRLSNKRATSGAVTPTATDSS